MKSLFDELRRRNVFRSLAIYCGAAWLLVQVATQVFPFFDVPNWAVRWVVIATLAGVAPVVVLAWFYEITPGGLKRESELDPTAPRSAPTRSVASNMLVLAAVGTVLLLAGASLHHWAGRPDSTALSMAVMPFKNLSAGQDEAYFTEGIQDEIQTRLSKIADLQVISPSSVGERAAQPADPRAIAQQLGVSHFVEGSVQRSGASARIIVRLIAAATSTQIWGETYDRQLTNVFDVESEVAKAIVDALRAKLTPSEKRELSTDPTRNPEAYDAYLRGVASFARVLQPGDIAESARWFGKAVDLDPDFALAWARLARVNAYRAYYGLDVTGNPCEQARHAAETAWRLAPNLGETDLGRGYVRLNCDNDSNGAEQAFERARLHLPNDVDVLRAISQIKWQRGDWAGVLPYLSDAVLLDPRNTELLSTYAIYLAANRQFEPARSTMERAVMLDVTNEALKATAAAIDQADGSLDAAQDRLDGMPLRPEVADIFDYQMLQLIYRGQYEQARRELVSAFAGDLSGLGFGVADYYYLLATTDIALGDMAAARKTFADGYQALKRFDNGSLTANSSADVYLRAMLCLNAVGANAAALNGPDCTAIRTVVSSGSQLSLVTLEVLAQAELLGGNRAAAAAAIDTLLEKPYLSSRYRVPLTPALLAQDPIWAPLRGDARRHKNITP